MTGKPLGQHTHEEILSQPEVWKAILGRLATSSPPLLPTLSSYDRVIFTGCGSTYYLSQWAARLTETTHGVLARAVPASELFLFPSAWLHQGPRTLLVAVSRSGKTSETLRAVEAFHAGDYGDSLAFTCYPENRLADLTTAAVGIPEAQEISIAQTRSFTSMMLAIAWWLLAPLPTGLERTLPAAAQHLLDTCDPLACRLGQDVALERFFFLGSGPFFGLASEAMLKMKEMSLSASEAYHFLEFRHGPKSMVDGRSLVVGLLSPPAQDYELAVLREMRGLGARILVLTAAPVPRIQEAADAVVTLNSDLPSGWRAPLYLPFLQLLALRRALAKELNPDQPANLDAVVVLDD